MQMVLMSQADRAAHNRDRSGHIAGNHRWDTSARLRRKATVYCNVSSFRSVEPLSQQMCHATSGPKWLGSHQSV